MVEAAMSVPKEMTSEGLVQTARRAREAVDASEAAIRDAEPAFEATVEDYLEKQARRHGVDHEGNPRLPSGDLANIARAYRTMRGTASLTLGYQAERYLAQVGASSLIRQSVADKARHLESFLDWIERETEARRVTKAKAAAYVDEVLMARDVSMQTRRNFLNTVRQFFDWMEVRDVIKLNPFDKTGKLLKDSTRGKEQKRRPWTPEELSAMLAYVAPEDPLWAFTVLGAYTGARREDLCALKVDAVDGHFLQVREGKTAAAVRRVPVHPTIRPLVARLVKTSPDGYLLPGLLTGGDDSKRGHYLGKRFSYALRRAGISDPKVVFHAFRNAVLTQMEEAAVPLSIRQQIVGHKRRSVTEEVYTARAADKVLAAAIAHVSYGAKLDELVHSVGKSLTITHTSKRRQ